jgi:hypothetical protein
MENENMAVQRDEAVQVTPLNSAPSASQFASATPEAAGSEAFDVDARPVTTMAVPEGIISSGWAAAKAGSVVKGDYPVEFKASEEAQLVKFIDNDESIPFATYRQHWLNKEGQRSFTCLGARCPLCRELADKAELKRAFTVVNLSAVPFQRQIIVASNRFFDIIAAAESGKQGPLKKNYWSITRTGSKQSTNYFMQSVKPADLQEEWQLDPAVVENELKAFAPYDTTAIRIASFETLQQIVKEIS